MVFIRAIIGCLGTGHIRAMAKSSTSFKTGKSGNTCGRPKVVGEVKDLARKHTTDAIKVLAGIMNDDRAAVSARIAAAQALLDRAWGRTEQQVSMDPDAPYKLVVEIRDPTNRVTVESEEEATPTRH